ncbi:geranylgeranyl reductase family protein [Chryseolinea soli]|uniref:Geranylgeranyl reductase family protein n=1 Tax=Chryseolinea soli TaxID=2321403 RepID=A0A385SME7_9BACT|nr:geranylgeranyl reductase family protein [Chryseolinea soli]AYB31646.1 geranylgeranyl reductase family protein [Chryseolinea soli]
MADTGTKEFDVIICGAGPAGSTCALALGDSGLRVAVLEKSSFPRDKTCGDAVAAYVPKVLATINSGLTKSLEGFTEKVNVNTCRLVAPNQKAFDLRFSQTGFISRRMDWDNFLFENAAAQSNTTFFLNHTISDVTITSDGVTVTAGNTEFKGKMVIGCDGAHSVLNRKVTGTRPDPAHHCGAVRAYYSNVSGIPDHTFEIHLVKDLLPGYFWIFPVKNNLANVGLGVLSSVVSKRRMDLRASLQRVVDEIPYISDRFKNAERVGKVEGFGLPLGSRKVPMSGDRFMLCGDAASLIDPLSGEGIGQAIVSGRYAGWHAKTCFDKNDFSASHMKQYDAQVYQKFWSRHRKNYYIQQLMNNEWLLNGVFNAALKSSVFRNVVSKSFT